MSAENKKKGSKSETLKALQALYCAGRVKPTLTKIKAQLESDSKNIDLILLACQCLVRTKDFDTLSSYADDVISLAPKNANGYHYKGIALYHKKGKEQDALKNFTEALALSPENMTFLKSKGSAHYLLFTDYNLPIKFADKHRVKAEESLLKVIELIEQMTEPTYKDLYIAGEVRIMLGQAMDAKRYFFKAVNLYESADPADQDVNIYKDIVKAQKESKKLMDKPTE